MTRCKTLIAGLGLAAGIVGLAGSAHAGDVGVALDFTYASGYYWRGADAGGGRNGFVQPSLDLSYPVSDGSVGVNIWYSAGPEADATDNSEIDYTVYGSYTVSDVAISVGVIDYVIPVGAAFADGHVLEANAGVDVGALIDPDLSLGIAVYMNLDGDGDENALYINPSVGYSLGHLGVGLSLGMASDSDYYGIDGSGLVDITPSVSFDIPAGDDASASVGLAIGYNPETNLTVPFFSIGSSYNWNP